MESTTSGDKRLAAQALQSTINDLQEELHRKVKASDAQFDAKKNVVYAERHKCIQELIESNALPSTFWADVLINTLDHRGVEDGELPHYLGPYDKDLLRLYLRDIEVEHSSNDETTVRLNFRPNPFFEENTLWMRCSNPPVEVYDDDDDDDNESVDSAMSESWTFSGVTWKEGHGPEAPSPNDERDDAVRQRKAMKRDREEATPGVTCGPTMFRAFRHLPPRPLKNDDEDDEEEGDAEELSRAEHAWENEMEDRRLLFDLLTEDLYIDPCSALDTKDEQECDNAAPANRHTPVQATS